MMHGFFVVVGMLAWPAIWFWFVKKRVGRGLFMSNVLGAIVGFVVATIILGIAAPKPTEEERVAQETARRDKAAAAAKEEAIAAQKKLEEEKNRDRSTMAAIICTNYVEQSLKSPKSADFPFGQAEGGIQRMGDQRYKIRSYVDAKNAFGAEIRTWYLCDIQYRSGEDAEMRNWTIKQLKFEE
ncbi:hypothetical protein [Pseudomonas fluorescens]|uniref:hypothetical protein n=1 Tax=Pseudomonas fluorescens TaxID=294 RepID=UPI00192C8DAB|nr:hypothetical protein [Pseudomonas fluorescens]MBL4981707.1 hypothetical protein [Pseudomonas fluorescens]